MPPLKKNVPPKPSAKAKRGATVAQSTGAKQRPAPQQANLRPAQQTQRPAQPTAKVKPLTMSSLGLGEMPVGNWVKADDYFTSDEDFFSAPFVITGARKRTNQFGSQVVFDLCDELGGEKYLLSLQQNDERLEFVHHFERKTEPIGYCVFQRIQGNQPNPYMKIVGAETMQEWEQEESENEDTEED